MDNDADAKAYRDKTLDPSFKGVFFDYLTKVLYENEKNYKNQTYKICKEFVMPSYVVAYMRKNHFLVNEINEKIDQLKSNGLLSYWIKQHTVYRHQKGATVNSNPSKLKMENVRGAFEILFYGLIISFIVLLLEKFSDKIKTAFQIFSNTLMKTFFNITLRL